MRRPFVYIFGIAVVLILALLIMSSYVFFQVLTPPKDFSQDQFIEIPPGSTLNNIAEILEEKAIISSSDWFKLAVYVFGKQQDLKSGTYYFSSPTKMDEVIRTVVNGAFNVPTERVTILEGEAAYQFSKTIADALPRVEQAVLLQLITSQQKEGYLYPDTYFFPQDATEEDVINIMELNFADKIEPYQTQIDTSVYTLHEILTMASLIENEAGSASYQTKRNVSGVLWKRVEIGMPIQADAVFSYIYQEYLPRVLFRHLEVESPYNIYKNPGLPPGPISSPSIDSIRAALDPEVTDNLFYLTGFDGKFYYAKTNGGHERNRRLYLNYK